MGLSRRLPIQTPVVYRLRDMPLGNRLHPIRIRRRACDIEDAVERACREAEA